MISDAITDDQLKIRVHHIGGIGGCGPTEVLEVFGGDVKWIIYDAEETSLSECTGYQEKDCLLVNRCLGGTNSKGKFNITFAQSASSMLPPAPSAAQYALFWNGKALIWGEHARVVKSVDIEINTLDWLIDNKKLPPVDFLSIDAQGAELDIMNGASKMLKSATIGIVCEVEFAELYSGQPLFCDIQSRLRKDGFRLCELLPGQYFNIFPYVNELQGKGFLTVSEALFLKNSSVLIDDITLGKLSSEELTENVIRCIKLAAVAVAFDQLDSALRILRILHEKKLVSLERLAEKSHCNYIKLLRDLIRVADVVEANTSPLVYNWEDMKPKSDIKSEMATSKRIAIFLRFVMARIMRIFAKYIMKKNIGNYYSQISKVFHAYGLYVVADKHDMRVVMNLISPFPEIMVRFLIMLRRKLLGW